MMIENQKKKRPRKKPRRIIAECVTQTTFIYLEEEQGKSAYYLFLARKYYSQDEKPIEIKIDYHPNAYEIGLGLEKIGAALKRAHDVLREKELNQMKWPI